MSAEPAHRGQRTAMVTGGGHGIGGAIARRLAAAGTKVLILGRSESELRETAEDIVQLGGQCRYRVADVADEVTMRDAFENLLGPAGGLDILVCNAGIAGPTKDLVDLSLEEWSEVLDVNLTGVFLTCRAAIPRMRDSGGRIVIVGSVLGKRPMRGRTPYAASKLGLVGLTRSLAAEVGEFGVTVNCISPWNVAGPRADLIMGREASARSVDIEVVKSEWLAQSPLGTVVTADDVADLVTFLASEQARTLTGLDINVAAGAVM